MNSFSTAPLSRYVQSAARVSVGALFVGVLVAGLIGIGVLFALFLLVTAVVDGIAVGAAILALMIGGLIAVWLGTRRGAAMVNDVPPGHIPETDVINVSRVPVAGVAGLGLIVIAAAAAFQFKLAFVVVVAGFIGGAAGAVLLVLLRRRRHSGAFQDGAATLHL